MNNKGFTMVEILGVTVLLGILMSVAIGGVVIYKDKAAQQAYDTMAKSSMNAAKNYMIDYPSKKVKVGEYETFDILDLYNDQYLERPADPKNEGKLCKGEVKAILSSKGAGGASLQEYRYEVKICCANYSKLYKYPEGTVTATTCS